MLEIKTFEQIYDATNRAESDAAQEMIKELGQADINFRREITSQFIRITWSEFTHKMIV